jgi:CRISPR-associated protein Cas5d
MSVNLINVRVWGDFACWSRPELKVERVSYPIMTPSAARGVLEAIFWHPQMFYLIDSIRVVKKGKWTRFKRNEVKDQISLRNYEDWLKGKKEFQPIVAGAGEGTASSPRNTLALYDVEYIISAEIRLTELGKNENQLLQKYQAEIVRRIKQGKCFHRPSFGNREFAADFDWTDEPDEMLKKRLEETKQDAWTNDCGLILYDVFSHKERNSGLSVSASPSFFHARVENSVMNCNPNNGVRIIHQEGEIN